MVVASDYPASVTVDHDTVAVSLEVPSNGGALFNGLGLPNLFDGEGGALGEVAVHGGEGEGAAPAGCWLFAHGTDMMYAYHGASRGATCSN